MTPDNASISDSGLRRFPDMIQKLDIMALLTAETKPEPKGTKPNDRRRIANLDTRSHC